MRYFKILLCLVLTVLLSACSKSEFMDLGSFIYNYNSVSQQDIDFTDFFFEKAEKRELKLINGSVLLTLKEASDGKIEQCRVMLTKVTQNGEVNENLSADCISFRNILKSTIEAFCGFDETTAEALIREFGLESEGAFLKEGELTKKQGSFYFVYYSTSLTSQMMIYNTYLTEIEQTEKPVSKPDLNKTQAETAVSSAR